MCSKANFNGAIMPKFRSSYHQGLLSFLGKFAADVWYFDKTAPMRCLAQIKKPPTVGGFLKINGL